MKFLRFFFKASFYCAVMVFTWLMCLYLRSDIAPPRGRPTPEEWTKAKAESKFFDKAEHPEWKMNHIFLHGTPFEHGLAWGSLTGDRLYRQEKNLVELYSQLMPSKFVRKAFEAGLIAVFDGIEESFEPWMTEEMWGVSQSASKEFNSFASPYTRQLAYHGIHEVGQMFVDLAPLGGACTFVSYPVDDKWIVGRTFDFEGGRIFDEEKVVKWVYPEKGFKYLSVIWTGMVGSTSGVNEKGIYVSINAAGSKDMNLRGLPSTLLVTKVLQEAANIEDALRIFRDNDTMITDIYMVLDSHANRLFKVEKSANELEMTEIKKPTAVTNHLDAKVFENDEFNKTRRDDFTSTYRLKRAQALLDEMKAKKFSREAALSSLLKILRDKGVDDQGNPLHLGNRRAIDALIASHGVLYDSKSMTFYVTEGPAMVGALHGYDVLKSFQEGKPVQIAQLPADPAVSLEQYQALKTKLAELKDAYKLIANDKCETAYQKLEQMNFQHVEAETAFVQAALCLKKKDEAKAHAALALKLSPPQKALAEFLEEVMKDDKN